MDELPADGDAGRTRPAPTATQRALGLLVRREHSRKELAVKLAARGIDKDQARAAIDRLASDGWQDDARFAESLARSRMAAGYGPVRIRAELGTHGIGAGQVGLAIAACEADWNELARALIARRFKPGSLKDPGQRRKAIDLLLRRGFDRASAFGAVDGISGAVDAPVPAWDAAG